MTAPEPEPEPLLTQAEVARMFRVDAKTVRQWAAAGKLTSVRTLGGHRRYREAEVRGLLTGGRCARCTYLYDSAGHRKRCLGRPS